MRRPCCICLLLCSLTLMMGGCGGETVGADDDTSSDETQALLTDEEMALELWARFATNDAYLSWSYFPNGGVISLSGDHSNNYVVSFVDETGEAAFSSWTGAMPEGSIIVKAQYSDPEGSTLTGFTAMQKIEGYDPDHNDWFWAAYNYDGSNIPFAGKESYCYGCHAQAAANDYVVTYTFPSE